MYEMDIAPQGHHRIQLRREGCPDRNNYFHGTACRRCQTPENPISLNLAY